MLSSYIELRREIQASYLANKKSSFELHDGNPTIIYFMRPVSMCLTPFFVWLGISANGATWIGTVLGLLASTLMATGSLSLMQLAVWVYLVHVLFDHIDGNLARYRGATNHYGKFLDGTLEILVSAVFYLSLGLGVYYLRTIQSVVQWAIPGMVPHYFVLAGGIAAVAPVAASYMELRYSVAVKDAASALTNSEPSLSGKPCGTGHRAPSVGVFALGVRAAIRRVARLSISLGLVVQWTLDAIKIPALFVAVYTETLTLYLLLFAAYHGAAFASRYTRILFVGSESLKAPRPF